MGTFSWGCGVGAGKLAEAVFRMYFDQHQHQVVFLGTCVDTSRIAEIQVSQQRLLDLTYSLGSSFTGGQLGSGIVDHKISVSGATDHVQKRRDLYECQNLFQWKIPWVCPRSTAHFILAALSPPLFMLIEVDKTHKPEARHARYATAACSLTQNTSACIPAEVKYSKVLCSLASI